MLRGAVVAQMVLGFGFLKEWCGLCSGYTSRYMNLEGFPEGSAELIGKRRIVLDGTVLTNKLLRLFVCRHGKFLLRPTKAEFSDLTFDRAGIVLQKMYLFLQRKILSCNCLNSLFKPLVLIRFFAELRKGPVVYRETQH